MQLAALIEAAQTLKAAAASSHTEHIEDLDALSALLQKGGKAAAKSAAGKLVEPRSFTRRAYVTTAFAKRVMVGGPAAVYLERFFPTFSRAKRIWGGKNIKGFQWALDVKSADKIASLMREEIKKPENMFASLLKRTGGDEAAGGGAGKGGKNHKRVKLGVGTPNFFPTFSRAKRRSSFFEGKANLAGDRANRRSSFQFRRRVLP